MSRKYERRFPIDFGRLFDLNWAACRNARPPSSIPASSTAGQVSRTAWQAAAPAASTSIRIDPPFNSNRNYEVFWGETKIDVGNSCRAFNGTCR